MADHFAGRHQRMDAWPARFLRIVPIAAFSFIAMEACRPGEVPRSPAPQPAPAAPPPAAGAPPETPPQPVLPRPAGSAAPQVRVGISVDTAAVLVSAASEFTVVPAQGDPAIGAPNEEWRFTPSGASGVSARSGSRTVSSPGPFTIRSAGGSIRIGGATFHGEAVVIRRPSGVSAINVVDLEDYLLGVVPREIGRRPASEIEAVKAQAVAARTYAIGHRGARANLGFDYHSGTLDQVYGGIIEEDSIATRAVRETRGEIVTYDGAPILAYYSSTCGGETAAIEESWPWRSALPYLVSVSDRIPGSNDYYCSPSNRFRWTTRWTRAQLLATLGSTLRAYTRAGTMPRRVSNVEITGRTVSGRVSMAVRADSRTVQLNADSVRWVLRTPAGGLLNSSRIDSVSVTRATDGDLDELAIHGGGWGHGIGMCQVGAMGRARAGQTYDQILATYYQGTRITQLY